MITEKKLLESFKLFFLFQLMLVIPVNGQDSYSSFSGWIQHVPRYLVSGYLSSVLNGNGLILGAATVGSLISLNLDEEVKKYAVGHGLMPDRVSRFGYNYGGSYAYILVISTIFTTARIKNEEPLATKQKLEYAGLIVACTELTTALLKVLVKRRRPNGSTHPNFFVRYSFPSGHTSGSFAVAAVTRELYGKNVGAAAYLLAVLVGISRIHDNDHYLSDVLFGAGLGLAMGRGFADTYRKYRQRKNLSNVKISFDHNRGGATVHLNVTVP
ncbi:MAG: phosphatase PAP2 family protein [Candidatus Neomarinimicrobiota bacterium]